VARDPPTANEDDAETEQRDKYLETFQNTARGLLYGAVCRALNARSEPSSRNKSVTVSLNKSEVKGMPPNTTDERLLGGRVVSVAMCCGVNTV